MFFSITVSFESNLLYKNLNYLNHLEKKSLEGLPLLRVETMIKNRFPKRKNGSADGISTILPHYYQQELETIQKKHAEELGNVSKKLEEVKEREAKEVYMNAMNCEHE